MLGHSWLALSDRVVCLLPVLLFVVQAELQMARVGPLLAGSGGVFVNGLPLLLFVTQTLFPLDQFFAPVFSYTIPFLIPLHLFPFLFIVIFHCFTLFSSSQTFLFSLSLEGTVLSPSCQSE